MAVFKKRSIVVENRVEGSFVIRVTQLGITAFLFSALFLPNFFASSRSHLGTLLAPIDIDNLLAYIWDALLAHVESARAQVFIYHQPSAADTSKSYKYERKHFMLALSPGELICQVDTYDSRRQAPITNYISTTPTNWNMNQETALNESPV